MSMLKRKNMQLVKELAQYLDENTLPERHDEMARKLSASLQKCCNLSLYGQNKLSADIKYFASINCKKKVCFVCNWLVQKQIRKKYMRWFKDNRELSLIRKKNGKLQAKTVSQIKAKADELNEIGRVEYDLMHLTLTVPHYADTGFRGDKYYFKKIADLYHYLRNESLLEIDGKKYRFDEFVYGGEYGVECTGGTYEKTANGGKTRKENTNGLNIHIHSLLFVRKTYQSRNKLHRAILMEWNRLTVNEYNERKVFTAHHKQQILKGNKLMTAEDVEAMSPKGASLIGLECIFTKDPKTGEKVRSKTFGDAAMMKAVMETISYHFEPLAFDKEDKKIDVALMVDLAPRIFHLSLFAKFGCLRGEKSLNISEKAVSVEEEFVETAEMLVDEDTGEVIASNDFFITSPANIFAIQNQDDKLILRKNTKGVIRFNADNSQKAVRILAEMAKKQYKK